MTSDVQPTDAHPSPEHVVALLEGNERRYKWDEVEQALAMRDEIIPRLIGILENVLANPETFANRADYSGHTYAIMLLGHFSEPRAHRVIAKLSRLPGELPDDLFGEIIIENLAAILVRTCDGSVAAIKELALDTSANEYCRRAAIRAIAYAVPADVLTREQAISTLNELLLADTSSEGVFFRSSVVTYLGRLCARESTDLISDAELDGLLHPLALEVDDFEMALEKGEARCLAELKAEFDASSLDDIHGAMSWWACFRESDTRPESPAVRPKKRQKSAKQRMAKASRKQNRRKKR